LRPDDLLISFVITIDALRGVRVHFVAMVIDLQGFRPFG
jgi:hypothetical protein